MEQSVSLRRQLPRPSDKTERSPAYVAEAQGGGRPAFQASKLDSASLGTGLEDWLNDIIQIYDPLILPCGLPIQCHCIRTLLLSSEAVGRVRVWRLLLSRQEIHWLTCHSPSGLTAYEQRLDWVKSGLERIMGGLVSH